jgi:hypothetical protein
MAGIGFTESLVSAPLKELQKRISEGTTNGCDPRNSSADWGLKDHLKQCLLSENGGSLADIPLLDFKSFHSGMFQNHSLVRYRGFIQDMFEPEFFISSYQSTPTSAFINASFADVVPEEDTNPTMSDNVCGEANHVEAVKERLPLFCMPRRPVSTWDVERHGGSFAPAFDNSSSSNGSSSTVKKVEKRSVDNDDEDEVTLNHMEEEEEIEETIASNKRFNSYPVNRLDDAEVGVTTDGGYITEDSGDLVVMKADVSFQAYCDKKDDLCCLVKLYDGDMEGVAKLNDVFEFIGILDAHPNNGELLVCDRNIFEHNILARLFHTSLFFTFSLL